MPKIRHHEIKQTDPLLACIKINDLEFYESFLSEQNDLNKTLLNSLRFAIIEKASNILPYLLSQEIILQEIESKMKTKNNYLLLAMRFDNSAAIETLLSNEEILISFRNQLKKVNLKVMIDFFWKNKLFYFLGKFFDSDYLLPRCKDAYMEDDLMVSQERLGSLLFGFDQKNIISLHQKFEGFKHALHLTI